MSVSAMMRSVAEVAGSATAADAGLLVIRLAVGLLVFGHGTRKLFGWFGGMGFSAAARTFDRLGYRPGKVAALAAGLCEAGSGVLLVTGLGVVVGSAALIGSMLNAALVQRPNGLWFANQGAEYPLVLVSIAAMLALTGPGALSVDATFGWGTHGAILGPVAIGAGILGAVAVRATRRTAT